MMMCPKCGAEMPDNTCTCSNCGEVLTSISSNTHGGDSIILNMHHTGNITDNALLCMSYLGFLVIVPLMLCKNTELARFHINQGLVLFITELCIIFAYKVAAACYFAVVVCNCCGYGCSRNSVCCLCCNGDCRCNTR